ncbi:MAG: FHA domain-containing protein [Candidatus Bruticola sp.]
MENQNNPQHQAANLRMMLESEPPKKASSRRNSRGTTLSDIDTMSYDELVAYISDSNSDFSDENLPLVNGSFSNSDQEEAAYPKYENLLPNSDLSAEHELKEDEERAKRAVPYSFGSFSKHKSIAASSRNSPTFDPSLWDSISSNKNQQNQRSYVDPFSYDDSNDSSAELVAVVPEKDLNREDTSSSEGFDGEEFDRDGFDREDYDSDGFDRDGFDRDGFDRDGFDRDGFDRDGFDRDNYDREGYDWEGYDWEGFDREGFDREGYDRDGFDRDNYDREGYDWEGYDWEGFDREGLDREGHDRESSNSIPSVSEEYNQNLDSRTDSDGFDRDGFDSDGFDRDGFDRDGFDRDGFDRDGFDRDGFDRDGFDRDSFDRDNYDREGYDWEGYDYGGFDRDGYDREGYTRQDWEAVGYTFGPHGEFVMPEDDSEVASTSGEEELHEECNEETEPYVQEDGNPQSLGYADNDEQGSRHAGTDSLLTDDAHIEDYLSKKTDDTSKEEDWAALSFSAVNSKSESAIQSYPDKDNAEPTKYIEGQLINNGSGEYANKNISSLPKQEKDSQKQGEIQPEEYHNEDYEVIEEEAAEDYQTEQGEIQPEEYHNEDYEVIEEEAAEDYQTEQGEIQPEEYHNEDYEVIEEEAAEDYQTEQREIQPEEYHNEDYEVVEEEEEEEAAEDYQTEQEESQPEEAPINDIGDNLSAHTVPQQATSESASYVRSDVPVYDPQNNRFGSMTRPWSYECDYAIDYESGSRRGQRISLLVSEMGNERTLTIGSPGERVNDIEVDEPSIANDQALLRYSGGRFTLINFQEEDIKLNKRLVTCGEQVNLLTGDEITLGSTTLVFRERSTSEALEAYSLDVVEGTETDLGKSFPLAKQRSTIGRDRNSDITLTDQEISRNHCTLAFRGGKFFLQHRSDTNPTFINGVSVPSGGERQITTSDKIKISSRTILQLIKHN